MPNIPLPDGWRWVQIGDHIDTQNGRAFKKTEWRESGLPIIRIENLRDPSASFNYFDGELEDRFRVAHGDLLFAWSGTPGTSFGAHIWIGRDAALNQHIWSLSFNPELIDAKWLCYALNAKVPEFIGKAAGGVGLAHITKAKFNESWLALPPLPLQKSNVLQLEARLSRLDKAVADLRSAEVKLKRHRSATLAAATSGRLVPTEAELARQAGRPYEPASDLLQRILSERRQRWEADYLADLKAKGKPAPKNDQWKTRYQEPTAPDTTNLPDLPEGWVWASLDQLLSSEDRSLQSGPFGSNLKHSEFTDTGPLCIGIDNVRFGEFSMGNANRISEAKYQQLSKYAARPGDVLMTVMATIGRTCVVPDDIEPSIITKHVYRMTVNRAIVRPHWLMRCLYGCPATTDYIKGNTIGQTRAGLNSTILRNIPVPIAGVLEQDRILNAVGQHQTYAERLEAGHLQTIQRTASLRSAILQQAFHPQGASPQAGSAP